MAWLGPARRLLRVSPHRGDNQRPLIELRDVSAEKHHSARHVSLSIVDEQVLAVVGDPGPAQHTFLQLLAGTLDADEGKIQRRVDLRLACSWLSPDLPEFGSVGDYISHPSMIEVGDRSEPVDTGGRNARVDTRTAASILSGLGGPGMHRDLHSLDEAERHRTALAATLASDAELTVLENPTRHLDISAIDWLGEHICVSTGSWVVATHDRALIDRTADRVAVIERGTVTLHEGNFSDLMSATPDGGTAADARTRRHRHEELAHLAGDEVALDPQRRVADYTTRQQAAQRRTYDFAEVQIPPGPSLDEAIVITTEGLTKFWAHRPVVKDLSIEIERGAIVGVVGPRGCGKTVLLDLLAGRQVADSGAVTTSDSARCAFIETGDLERYNSSTVWDAISGDKAFLEIGSHEVSSRAVLEAFGFHGHRQMAEGGHLTSAERDRLRLALTVTQGANILILDDPTGGMELDMLTALEDALLEFPGTVVISTHDRWLLERVATHIITPSHGPTVGLWDFADGGYEASTARRRDREAPTDTTRERGEPR